MSHNPSLQRMRLSRVPLEVEFVRGRLDGCVGHAVSAATPLSSGSPIGYQHARGDRCASLLGWMLGWLVDGLVGCFLAGCWAALRWCGRHLALRPALRPLAPRLPTLVPRLLPRLCRRTDLPAESRQWLHLRSPTAAGLFCVAVPRAVRHVTGATPIHPANVLRSHPRSSALICIP